MRKLKIVWADGYVRVTPEIPEVLKKALTYWHRQFVEDPKRPYQRIVRGMQRECFQYRLDISTEGIAEESLLSLPGFMHRIKTVLHAAGYEYEIVDERQAFPAPNYDAAMAGLREYQYESVWTMLESGGGIMASPTGWGKTHCLAGMIRAYSHAELCARNTPVVLITTASKDIAKQNYERLSKYLPDRDVGIIMSGKFQQSDDVQICTLDSLQHINMAEVGMVLVDEVHEAATEQRTEALTKAVHARRWGFSATPTGRFDGSDLLTEGIVGPKVYTRTYQEGVQDGALVPIVVYWIMLPPPDIGLDAYLKYTSRKGQYDHGVEKNMVQAGAIATLLRRIPVGMQTLCIMQHTAQMNFLAPLAPGIQYVHAVTDSEKLREQRQYDLVSIKPSERQQIYNNFRSGDIRKIMSTYVYKQGVDFPELQVVINAGGGGSAIASAQIPGRGSRKTGSNKDVAYMIDFYHDWDTRMVEAPAKDRDPGQMKLDLTCTIQPKLVQKVGPLLSDDRARDKVYEALGFERHWVNSVDELPFMAR